MDVLKHFKPRNVDLNADRPTGIRFYRSSDDDRRLLSECLCGFKDFLVVALEDYPLNGARAVAELQKGELAARSRVV